MQLARKGNSRGSQSISRGYHMRGKAHSRRLEHQHHCTSTKHKHQAEAPARACLSRVVGRVPDIAQWSLLTTNRLRVGEASLRDKSRRACILGSPPLSTYPQIDNCIVDLGLLPLPSWPFPIPLKKQKQNAPPDAASHRCA
ncbi:hypothetical protein BDP81DRAFT_19163 [Colletotrichum phormii]|uniref:Uncharacterized protein n=1 Tax=Colletotrichum phormii TaxID=359342 RepID=A0AAJ0A4E6_9PEZI|nr:uncharacterized protein BDP81DRAFT_19163 [Colletotrichum phormii]KAK1656278.1 hypothetical protein BDP81DRAFT_19163 [Colletotrichum phormii]